jgi:hypothetical protein
MVAPKTLPAAAAGSTTHGMPPSRTAKNTFSDSPVRKYSAVASKTTPTTTLIQEPSHDHDQTSVRLRLAPRTAADIATTGTTNRAMARVSVTACGRFTATPRSHRAVSNGHVKDAIATLTANTTTRAGGRINPPLPTPLESSNTSRPELTTSTRPSAGASQRRASPLDSGHRSIDLWLRVRRQG